MVMFDSLNKEYLSAYGADFVKSPNFKRLAEKSCKFNNFYAGSLPCMPARREIHTGRHNFLHRSWGPLEPFDNSMPEILKKAKVYTHLVSDHYHYFEDGGATYHNRYNSWELSRGQESDGWKGIVGDIDLPKQYNELVSKKKAFKQNHINRSYMTSDIMHPQVNTFEKGIEFISTNHKQDKWFLQIETFDPHEPFVALEQFRQLYKDEFIDINYDWPMAGGVDEDISAFNHMKHEYAALVTMCDFHLGKVLDQFDKYNLWEDTMLIVNTDHGFLLGEKDWIGKNMMPWYNELVNLPFFIYDPRTKEMNTESDNLAQTIDIAPTLLDFFDVTIPQEMMGKPIKNIIKGNEAHKGALYGMHGSQVNITDGRYVYMRGPARNDNTPLFEYTLMPTHMRGFFDKTELADIKIQPPFSFTKGIQTMKLGKNLNLNPFRFGHLLYDLQNDPKQEHPIDNIEVECKMCNLLVELMKKNNAPYEQYERLGLPCDREINTKDVIENRKLYEEQSNIMLAEGIKLNDDVKYSLLLMLGVVPPMFKNMIEATLVDMVKEDGRDEVKLADLMFIVNNYLPEENRDMIKYMIEIGSRKR